MLNLKRLTCLALVSMTGASLHILTNAAGAYADNPLSAPPGSFVQSTNSSVSSQNSNQALGQGQGPSQSQYQQAPQFQQNQPFHQNTSNLLLDVAVRVALRLQLTKQE
jgi:hypothetical protein